MGVPQSDDTGDSRYTFTYSRDPDYVQGDVYPAVVAENPKTASSSLSFYAPEYHY